MASGLPAVSCICLTYGRPALLEEAIESFLRQEYAGVKELVVLNDLADQTLRFEHPEVRLVNVPLRFRTVGEKRNAAIALASHGLLFPWDDDDICLPHRISFSVRHLDPRQGHFNPRVAWFWNKREIIELAQGGLYGAGCWTRELHDAAQGYAAQGSGEDQELDRRFREIRPRSEPRFAIDPADVYYLYRWAGTGSYHLSGYGMDRPGESESQAKATRHVAQYLAAGRLPRGEIELRPRWKAEYTDLARAAVEAHLARTQGARAFEEAGIERRPPATA